MNWKELKESKIGIATECDRNVAAAKEVRPLREEYHPLFAKWTPPERTEHNYIRTISGKKFWPLNPRAEDVDIEDVAHALSLMCRYNGHLPYLYSVGQHSLNVYRRSSCLWGLLHDATEAYLPDVPRPIKTQLPFFRDIEWRLCTVIAEALELPLVGLNSVKTADAEVLQWEYQYFRPTTVGKDVRVTGEPKPGNVMLEQCSPETIRAAFLYEYRKAICGKP